MSLAAASMPDTVDRPFESVFPLPLTPIEAFMAIDARPGYSWAVDMELRFRGCVDRGAFERALAVAVERNPLFTCRIDGGARGPYAWVPTDAKPSIAWLAESEDLGERYDAYVDLTAEPGLCVFVRQGEDRSRVLLHYHHACCDGIGGFSFVEDLLAAYAAAVGGEAIVAPRGLVPSRLVTRAQASVPYRTPWQQVGDSFVGLWEGLKLLFGRPQTIAAPTTREPDARAMGQQPAFISVTCSAEVKAGLRRVADEAGATTNDVLLRDLFLVLKRWNELHGGTGRRGPLRILMPQNLREPADAAAPAANIMSFAFLTRRARACERPEALLASIRDETVRIKRDKLSLYFLLTIGGVMLAGALPRVVKRKTCFSTAVLSNFSYPTRRFATRFPRAGEHVVAGNLTLESIAVVPPLRPRTHAAFGVISTADSLSITCKWDSHVLARGDAQRLLHDYHAQLQATAATGSGPR